MKKTILFTIALALTGCATPTGSVLLGTGIGATAGGLLGNKVTDSSQQGTVVGAAIGAGVGGLLGYLAHKSKKDKESKLQGPAAGPETMPDKLPFLTKPEVRTIWVEDAIQGNKFIEGHRVFILEKNSSWTK